VKMKSRLLTWVTRLCWAIVLLDLLLIFIFPSEIFADNLTMMLAYTVWLLLTLFLTITSLMVIYRGLFQSWIGWITPIIILIFSNLFSSGQIQIHNPRLSFFYVLLTTFSMWGVGVATIIFLWYRDVGLKLIASTLVIFTWAGFFIWYFQGNIFDLLIASINQPEVTSPLWWLNPFLCVFWWVIPIGICSFIVHTFRIFAREINRSKS